MNTHAKLYTSSNTHTYITHKTFSHTKNKNANTHMLTQSYKCTETQTHTSTYTLIHTYRHVQIHANKHTHIYINRYTQTHI